MKKKICYVDVCCDLFHYGHVNYFKKVLEMGDILYVGICQDDLIESYKRKPIMTHSERVAVVESCKYVDKVIKDPVVPITKKFIEENNIDLVLHADDMDHMELKKWYKEAMEIGKFKVVKHTPGISTTKIINRIQKRDIEY